MAHLKRLNAPKSWSIKKKGITFVARPMPGPHKLRESISLSVLIRDYLKYAKTTREVKKILNNSEILVNNAPVKDYHFPIGFFDTLELPKLKEIYILIYNQKGKFILKPIQKDAAASKPYKIINKKTLKGKKTQLNFYNGRNIIVDKDEYKVGDSIILSDNKIKKHLKLEKGALIFLTGGAYIGSIAELQNIQHISKSQTNMIELKKDEGTIRTLKKYAFVIEKPI